MIDYTHETPEEIEYNQSLQLKIFADAIHDQQTYNEIKECFTDVSITKQEYNNVLINPTTTLDFLRTKGDAFK